MINALSKFCHPIPPNTDLLLSDVVVDRLLELIYCCELFEGELFRYIFFFVVIFEGEGVEVEPVGWSEGHIDLVAEEGVGDVVGGVVVQKDHDDTANHLPDLVIDEALAH